MLPRPSLVALAVLTVPALSLAATGGPLVTLSQSGFVLDADDAPLNGQIALVFRIHTSATGTTPPEYEATCAAVDVRGGYYAVTLGAPPCTGTGGTGNSLLDANDLPPSADRWLEVQIGSVVVEPRLRLSPPPSALHALDADTLGGLPPSAFAAAGHTHTLAISQVTNLASELAGKLSAEVDPRVGTLTNGKWCTAAGGQVTCTTDAPAVAPTQPNASTGTPVACAPSTVGSLWFDPGTSALQICNGAFYATLGSVTPPPGPPSGLTVVPGPNSLIVSWTPLATATSYELAWNVGTSIGGSPVIVPAGTSPQTITGLTNDLVHAVAVRSVAGAWTSGLSSAVQGTPTANWTCLTTPGHAGCVSSSTYASCQAIRNDPSFVGTSGSYYIDPDLAGGATAPFQVRCDMTTKGGGWTRYLTMDVPANFQTLDGIPNSQEFVQRAGWIFSKTELKNSNREVLIAETVAPFRTHMYDFKQGSNLSGENFVGAITGDVSGAYAVWNWTTNGWNAVADGRCNTNNHTQWNCTPAAGVRFHIGTRDWLGDGGTSQSGTGWGYFTGYYAGYGNLTQIVQNWNGVYNQTAHDLYVR